MESDAPESYPITVVAVTFLVMCLGFTSLLLVREQRDLCYFVICVSTFFIKLLTEMIAMLTHEY